MLRQIALAASLALALPLALQARADETGGITERWRADPQRVFDATDTNLADLQWVARPIVVFANSPRDPAFIEQMQELEAEIDRLVERDVIIVTDTDPGGRSELRERLRPRGFMLVLIGKDGQIKLRKPQPRTVRELSRSIDKMPLRLQERREGRSLPDATNGPILAVQIARS